jgi:hypothetical protein
VQVHEFDSVLPTHVVPVRADLDEAIGVTFLKANENVCVATELPDDRLAAGQEAESGSSARDVQHAATVARKVIVEEIQLDEVSEELDLSLTIATSRRPPDEGELGDLAVGHEITDSQTRTSGGTATIMVNRDTHDPLVRGEHVGQSRGNANRVQEDIDFSSEDLQGQCRQVGVLDISKYFGCP